MNSKQWFAFGMGFIILSSYLFWNASIWLSFCLARESLCIIRYAYSIPAIISGFLGLIFFICSALESKKG